MAIVIPPDCHVFDNARAPVTATLHDTMIFNLLPAIGISRNVAPITRTDTILEVDDDGEGSCSAAPREARSKLELKWLRTLLVTLNSVSEYTYIVALVLLFLCILQQVCRCVGDSAWCTELFLIFG